MTLQKSSGEVPANCIVQRSSAKRLRVGLSAELINTISPISSLSKYRLQEICMPPPPKKLLDQLRTWPACPEWRWGKLVERMQSVSSTMPTAPRRATSTGRSDLSSVTAFASAQNGRDGEKRVPHLPDYWGKSSSCNWVDVSIDVAAYQSHKPLRPW